MFHGAIHNFDDRVTFLWGENDGIAITVIPSSVLRPSHKLVYGGWCKEDIPTPDELVEVNPYSFSTIENENFAFFRDSSEMANAFIAWPSRYGHTNTLLCNGAVTEWPHSVMHIDGVEYFVITSPANSLTYMRCKLLF